MKTSLIISVKLLLLISVSSSLSAQNTIRNTDFTAAQLVICAGESVQFTDLTASNPTAWKWQFNGGSPATSIGQHPVVIYNSPGKYNVILTASNAQGSHAKGVLSMITVMECTGMSAYHKNSEVKVFPNPAHSFVNVSTGSDARFTLCNAIGSVLLEGTVKKDEITKVNIDHLSAGLYFLNLREGLVTKSVKVIKE